MRVTFLIFLLFCVGAAGAQTQLGDRWVDNNLTIQVKVDRIKTQGQFFICIADTSRGECIENLVSGVEVAVFNAQDKLLWEGIASGRTVGLSLPKPMPNAHYLRIKTFKPWVVNKTTGTRIHQNKRIAVKYFVQ
jgi:hypothetical protein